MCKPIVIGQSDDFPHSNRSHLHMPNAIESENPIHLNATSTAVAAVVKAMPLNNISLSHNPFGLNSTKNDTFVAKWNVNATQPTEKITEDRLKENHSIESLQKVATANHSLSASHELNLATVNENDQLDNFKQRLKTLARTKTNIKSTGQIAVDTTKAPINSNVQSANTQHVTATKLNVLKTFGKKITHTTEMSVKLPAMQTTHQSTITTTATIQSVFLDYSNNVNGTKSQQHNDNKIIHNDKIRGNNHNHTATATAMVTEEILSRTERSVQQTSNKRKKLHNNDSGNAERIERSANFSLTRASRRIQLLLKGRFLQMLSDGTVNGTQDEQSEYSE